MRSRLRIILQTLSDRVQQIEHEVEAGITNAPSTILRSDGAVTRAAVLAAIVKVGRHGGISGIANLLRLSKSHTTTIVQSLEDDGCCHRIVRDGHTVHSILLTFQGVTFLSEIKTIESRVEAAALSGLTEEERTLFGALIGKALSSGTPVVGEEIGLVNAQF